MQKLVNVIALLSGLTSLAVIGGGVYLYKNADVLMEDARKKVTSAAVEAVQSALPNMLESAMPKMPEVTGGAIPSPSNVGGGFSSMTGPSIPLRK